MARPENKKERLKRFGLVVEDEGGDMRKAIKRFLDIPSISDLARRLDERRSDVDLCISAYREPSTGRVRVYPRIRRKMERLLGIPAKSFDGFYPEE